MRIVQGWQRGVKGFFQKNTTPPGDGDFFKKLVLPFTPCGQRPACFAEGSQEKRPAALSSAETSPLPHRSFQGKKAFVILPKEAPFPLGPRWRRGGCGRIANRTQLAATLGMSPLGESGAALGA